MADGFAPIIIPRTVIGFAGAGGSSYALKLATGLDPSVAMNHWDKAVYTHQRLFPRTEHYCADIYEVDPDTVLPGEAIRWAWFSPDCTDHSKAKGGAPKAERIRGLAWSIIPWAVRRRVQTIMFENVEEWLDWGPVYRCADDWRAQGVPGRVGDPIKALRRVTRLLFVRRLLQAGYWPEFRVLRTADFGKATTRKRLYGIFEYVGAERVACIALGLEPSPIDWAQATHAPRKTAVAKGLMPWVGFDTCADWSEPCPSIFLDAEEVEDLARTMGRRVKRPLVAATLKRVARGLERYVIASADPFIVPITQQVWGGDRTHGVRDPLPTMTAAKGGEFALVIPHITKFRGGATGHEATKPLATLTANGFEKRPGGALPLGVVAATIVGCGGRRGQSPPSDIRGPFPTVTAKADACIAAAFLVRQFGAAVGGADVTEPHPTVMPGGAGKTQLIAAHLGCYYGEGSIGSNPADPMRVATGKARHALTMAWLEQANTGVVGHDAREPVSTIIAGGGPDCGWGGATQRLIQARLEMDGGPVSRRDKVLAFLWEHFGLPTEAEWLDPTGTLEARKKFGIVLLHDQVWFVVDIGLRMLLAREMAAATGLPPEHDLSFDVHGRRVSKTHQTMMIGNMVPAEPAASLIRTQCPDMIQHPAERTAA